MPHRPDSSQARQVALTWHDNTESKMAELATWGFRRMSGAPPIEVHLIQNFEAPDEGEMRGREGRPMRLTGLAALTALTGAMAVTPPICAQSGGEKGTIP